MKFTSKPVHLIALDEQRKEFQCIDVAGADQVGFRGVHSDVGGGYRDNEFDWLARDFMVERARLAGVQFDSDVLDSYSRTGSARYQAWQRMREQRGRAMDPENPAYDRAEFFTRSGATPTDNSRWFYNDGEPGGFPKDMTLHPSVGFFNTSPRNDIRRVPWLTAP
jgi:hypothetical protein